VVICGNNIVPAALCLILLFVGKVHGHEEATRISYDREEVKSDLSDNARSGYRVLPFPSGQLYDQYTADPRKVDFGLQVLHYLKSSIPDTGNERFDLKTGGYFGLVRVHPRGARDLGWELGLEAGMHGQFDVANHWDSIGWDGWYSFLLTAAPTKRLSFKFGWLHDSSHVGDEYAERMGRQRIGYTREELAAGVSLRLDGGWRTYAEYGRGMTLGNVDLQKPGRVQAGIEWQPVKHGKSPDRGWYCAADLSAMQERDWKVDVSLQAGYMIDSGDKTWRFGLDWYNGRPPIGEFFQYTEQYIGFGVWVDI
jgi:hypothetical protein